MKTIMVHLTIDGRAVDVPEGSTILAASLKAGVRIPTLCHLEGHPAYTSCMMCVVKDNRSDALIPACSARVADGMDIDTACKAVREARRAVIDLLLSEHVGDCEAPCRLACPACMDIPAMIRAIAAGDFRSAYAVVMEHIPLPATLGWICPAPCEKVCRRSHVDDPVAICLLKRFSGRHCGVGDVSAAIPECAPDTGHRVAVVGAGPAGLSAAYFLRRSGQSCVIMERAPEPGGALHRISASGALPADVLDAEIGTIGSLGVEWQCNVALGREVSIEELKRDFDAVVLAVGSEAVGDLAAMRLAVDNKGLAVNRDTLAVDASGLFAAGACVRPTRMAVRAVADGNLAAASVCAWLNDPPAVTIPKRFNSRTGILTDVELHECLKGAGRIGRLSAGSESGFSDSEAVQEASRCMNCDCRDKERCGLRTFAEEYHGSQRRYLIDVRPAMSKTFYGQRMVVEPGKCIRCGKCVRICEDAGVRDGLTFLGRGLDVHIGVPFNADLSDVPDSLLDECVRVCPTGALARP